MKYVVVAISEANSDIPSDRRSTVFPSIYLRSLIQFGTGTCSDPKQALSELSGLFVAVLR